MTFIPTGKRPEEHVLAPASIVTLLVAAVIGVLFDLTVRASDVGLLSAMFLCFVAVAVTVVIRPVRNRWSLLCLSAVPFFAVWLAIRDSDWLVPFDILVALLLLTTAAFLAPGGSPFASTVGSVFALIGRLLANILPSIPFIAHPIGRAVSGGRSRRAAPVVRGLLIAAPLAFVLIALLASADAVFASVFSFDIPLGDLPGHLIVALIGIWGFAILARGAQYRDAITTSEPTPRLGATEALITLGALVTVFAAFVFTQVVVWAGGAERVLQTAGLTYADHAREGFFQLLAVAIITLVVLLATRAATVLDGHRQQQWFRALTLAAIALILVIVASAVQRLALYENAYGLTMLRLYSTIFAGWIASVFVILAVLTVARDAGRWFLGTAIAILLAILFGLNVANPEAIVAQRNLDRSRTSAVEFDTAYLSSLSSDAAPVLSEAFKVPAGGQPSMALTYYCRDNAWPPDGWAMWNWSRQRATQELRDCRYVERW